MQMATDVKITIQKDDGTSVKKSFLVLDGLSAYDSWLNAGNIGDEKKFLESLKGEKGDSVFTETKVLTADFEQPTKFSGGNWWKKSVALDDASDISRVNVSLGDVPCDSENNPLMYTLNIDFDGIGVNRVAIILLTIFGEVAQFRNIKTDEFRTGSTPAYTLTYWR
ncbi:hypothetical protein ABMA09_14025 [Erwinia rhapontici]|uniref:hypothetical protein n=1 Tax=Erwinia rhapontici TaxID=55212 RepID=UPI003D365B22